MKISKEQRKAVQKIAEKYNLKLVMLFGSFASGKTHKNSDLDIAVMGEKKIDFKEQIKLINNFSQVFKRDVDLSIINAANPLLLFQISKNAKIIFGSRQDFHKFRIYSFHRYNDYLPYFKMEADLNKKFIDQYVH